MKTAIKKYLFTFLILSACITQDEVSAQSNSTEDIVTAPNAIFVEVAGQGIIFSANYDRMLFDTTPHNIALRVGIGFWAEINFSSSRNESGVTIPVNASYLFGGNHKFELGVGFTFAPDISIRNLSDWMITAFIGYRYQPIDGVFLFRAGAVPILGDEGIIKFFGFGLGFAF